MTTPEGMKAIAVKNTERLAVLLQNDKNEPVAQNIALSSGKQFRVELPGNALCAVVFQ